MDETNVDAMVQRIQQARKTMPEGEAAGPLGALPWPRVQMNVMYRMLAGEMDLPSRCADRRCRRLGHCRGGLGGGDSDACVPLWGEADMRRLEAACLALVLGWICEAERLCAMAEMLRGAPVTDGGALDEAALP